MTSSSHELTGANFDPNAPHASRRGPVATRKHTFQTQFPVFSGTPEAQLAVLRVGASRRSNRSLRSEPLFADGAA